MQMMNHGGRRPGAGAAWAAGLAAILLTASLAEASPTRTYRVKAGDTLSGIAWQQHGAARKWVPLYRQNRKLIGANPHLIFPGQRLLLLPDGKSGSARRQPVPPSQAALRRLAPLPAALAPAPHLPSEGATPSDAVSEASAPLAPIASPSASRQAEPMAAFDVPASMSTPPLAVLNLPEPVAAPGGANPWLAAGASTLIPGAGQAYLGNWSRGGLYAGAAALLYGAAQYGVNARNEALTRTGSLALLGISLAAPIDAFLEAMNRPPAAPETDRKEARP